MDTDCIEKKITLMASRERVWRALTDSAQFGAWFGVELDGPFVVGKEITGRIVPTRADPGVARHQEPYKGMPWRALVEQIEPMDRFSFRWHPYAIDTTTDYSREPMTLVTFELRTVEGGTLLTITESGFDLIPAARRAKAFESNSSGWSHQAQLIEKYLLLESAP